MPHQGGGQRQPRATEHAEVIGEAFHVGQAGDSALNPDDTFATTYGAIEATFARLLWASGNGKRFTI